MVHLIDKDALVTEIERRIDDLYDYLPDASKVENGTITISEAANTGKYTALESFRDYIDTLEVKEVDSIWNDACKTIPEDSSNQIICIKEDDLAVATVGKLIPGTKKWAYLHDLLNISNVQVKEVDLEKELKDFIEEQKAWVKDDRVVEYDNGDTFNHIYDLESVARHFFELGLKAQKGE